MFSTMKQTMYNENIFVKRKSHLIVGGVLDKQDQSDTQYSYFLHLIVIIFNLNPCS